MLQNTLEKYKKFFDEKIDELYPDLKLDYDIVLKASRYSLCLGGKRIRPVIVMEFCKMLGGDPEKAAEFAVALEMIHTYSLIHDDLPCMDNDDMRRGKPACHIEFGENTALLAGDTLLTEAFGILAKAKLPDDRIVKAVKVLSHFAGLHGMIGGQVLDLQFEKTVPNAEMLKDMYSKKTAGLLTAASMLGCIAAGKLSDDTLDLAAKYGYNLGVAFQVIDDILDYTADETLLGKPTLSDQKNKKTTFVTIYGIEKAKNIAGELTNKALETLKQFNGDTWLLELLTKYLLERNY